MMQIRLLSVFAIQNKKNYAQMKKYLDNLLALLLGLIVVIMFAQVLFRYVFNNSLAWSEELIRFVFVWLTFIGGAILIRDNAHIAVEFFVERLPARFFGYLKIFNLAIVAAFLGAMAIIGFYWVYHSRGLYSSALGLPVNIALYGALPISAIAGIWYSVKRIIEEIQNLKEEY